MVTSVEAGIDSVLLNDLTEKIKTRYYPDIHSVLIAQHGKAFYEQYFAGADENYGKSIGYYFQTVSTLHNLKSITKKYCF